ncbi:MAG: hypothetical protein A2029_15485 [Chloroflexi bacterium RBG_19FT_COMBO_47_9]|nr:MAG: hypothetical protein A2029_15485 [Chloroflexi bacterium RBG_19FT_COMBO_47_9]
MNTSQRNRPGDGFSSQELIFLNPNQVIMIDEALAALGDYGEVRLIVEKGRLRFLVTQKSFDALKWRPGSVAEETG